MKSIGLFILATLLATPVLTTDAFEIWLWGNAEASRDKRVLEIKDHPACTGKIVRVHLERMPVPDEALEGEKVVELSANGKVINTWYMPVNEIVLGVEGSCIVTGYCNSAKALKIGTDGQLSSVEGLSCALELIECSETAGQEFPDSAYIRCFEYKDLQSGEKRRLAFQGPCT